MILQKDHVLFNYIYWISQAISKDPSRLSLTRICIERTEDSIHIIATDGHRLHRVILDKENYNFDDIKLQSGMYIPMISKSQIVLTRDDSEDTGKYPDYKRIIPDPSDRYKYELEYSGKKMWYQSYSKILMIFNILLEPNYFQQAFDISGTWNVYIKRSTDRITTAIYAESGECSVVIIPIRLLDTIGEQIKDFKDDGGKPVFESAEVE